LDQSGLEQKCEGDMKTDNLKHSEITDKIIRAYYSVYNTLGYGFLEKVYENAMLIELKKMNILVERQKKINVYYEGKEVGLYFADLIVGGSVIIELKAAENLCEEHELQLLNYLKATQMEIGLLLNFGKRPQFKRKIFSNPPHSTLITQFLSV
jgi:GxxExxY protein